MKEYREVNEEYALEECLGTPYAMAGRSVAASLKRWKAQHAKPEDSLLVFFEDGTKHKGDFMEAMKRDLLPCPAFIDKKKSVALQAADLLAWQMFMLAKNPNKVMRPELKKLVKSLSPSDPDMGIYHKDDLVNACIEGHALVRSEMPKGIFIAHHSTPKRRRTRTIK
jgi:hypothetical protein